MKLVPVELLKLLTEPDPTGTPIFTLKEAKSIIRSLLTKRSRGNGGGRRLLQELRRQGWCHHSTSHPQDRRLGFSCTAHPSGYTFKITGHPYSVGMQLFSQHQRVAAHEASKHRQNVRRDAYAEGTPKPAKWVPPFRALAGAAANLRQHFKQSKLTFGDAAAAIAYAARKSPKWMVCELMESLDLRSVASFRLPGGFVFRVDIKGEKRNALMVGLHTPTLIWSTDDNKHGAYRRLRAKLRQIMNKASKARKREQEAFIKRQRLFRRVARAA